MPIIYQPKGAALEYSPLAANLWTTCSHGCKYCYAPACLRKKPKEFFVEAPERKDVLRTLEQDCKAMAGDPRPVLLCFVCDPYQPHEEERAVTRQALEILEKYRMTAQVLTKGGLRAARDFDILKRNGWKFGTTLSFVSPHLKGEWEPNAAMISERINAIQYAHSIGIYTWVSVEPVIDPEEALELISRCKHVVDFWKIGKLNHSKELELKVDWKRFLRDAQLLLKGRPHYIKTDLLSWGDGCL
jgi:DNA repair photolyase